MARQESQSKLLYYPTSDLVIDLAATWYTQPAHSRLSDPCVGQGEALARFKANIGGNAETWGVELSYARAELAMKVVDVVLPESFYFIRWADNTVSFCLDNPPYDWSPYRDANGKTLRHERMFITKMTSRLVAGGQHLIIILRNQLLDEELARHLAGWYERLVVFGYPDSEFDQVVLLAQKRAKYQPPSKLQIEGLTAWGHPDVALTPLCPGDGRYVIPPAPVVGPRSFTYTPTTHEALSAAAVKCSPLATKDWRAQTYVRPVGAPISPMMPEKIGFIAMRLSSGDVGELPINTPQGLALAKGTLTKQIVQKREAKFNDKGEHTGDAVEDKERLTTCITLTHANGDIQVIETPQAVGEFITAYADVLADALIKRDVPLYDFQPTQIEWDVASQVGIQMPPLPGRKERGLFEMQSHFAIATKRGMRDRKAVIMNCDMGFGKTLTAIAALEELDAWPAVVYVPGHMVEKWRRDLERGSNPAEPIQGRIVDAGALPAADVVARLNKFGSAQVLADQRIGGRRQFTVRSSGRAMTNVVNYARNNYLDPHASYADDGEIVVDPHREEDEEVEQQDDAEKVTAWLLNVRDTHVGTHYANVVLPMVAEVGGQAISTRRLQVRPTKERSGRLRTILVQIGDTNASSLAYRLRIRGLSPRQQKTSDGWEFEIEDKDPYTLPEFVAEYKAGALGRKAVAIVAFDPGKNDAGLDRIAATPMLRRVWDEERGKYVKRYVQLCPQCGQALSDASIESGFCQAAITRPVFDESGKIIVDANGDQTMQARKCGCALRPMTRWRRVAIARLIRDKYAHFFQVYIMDEAHKAKSGSTDIGGADGKLISSTRYSIALTGTLFGGYSSSLFYLLYRRVKEVRSLYRYRDVSTFVHHFGLYKYTYSEPVQEGGRGASTGIQRYDYREKEIPGISPAVTRFLLPHTLFAKITDLGYELPPLDEDIIRIDMGDKLGRQYAELDNYLFNLAKSKYVEDKDCRYFSAWASTTLRRPNAAFRDEVVRGPEVDDNTGEREILMELPAVISDPTDLLPKEKTLVEMIAANIKAGRKTLVFVEQSASRDIRQRLAAVLKAGVPGVRVGVLNSSLKPEKREAWIEQNVPQLDVLLVNPKLVETGLDLVQFSEITFYELNYSLYTLWQAMRRVWRLGQANRVRTTFLIYSGSAEETALRLMGQKMKTAMVLYGDNAAGALVAETEEGEDDIQRELIRRALVGKAYEDLGELNGVFTTPEQRIAAAVTSSPMGSPTATTPTLPIVTDNARQLALFDEQQAAAGNNGGKKRRRTVIVVNKGQPAFVQSGLF